MSLDTIFVFGSNLSGIHGAGAARYALRKKGAMWGIGEGLSGRSYALPTKGIHIVSMPRIEVVKHVDRFLRFADEHPELTFDVTRIGCGLAGFKDEQIAPLFLPAGSNCRFDLAWKPYLGEDREYWGTF